MYAEKLVTQANNPTNDTFVFCFVKIRRKLQKNMDFLRISIKKQQGRLFDEKISLAYSRGGFSVYFLHVALLLLFEYAFYGEHYIDSAGVFMCFLLFCGDNMQHYFYDCGEKGRAEKNSNCRFYFEADTYSHVYFDFCDRLHDGNHVVYDVSFYFIFDSGRYSDDVHKRHDKRFFCREERERERRLFCAYYHLPVRFLFGRDKSFCFYS